MLARGGEKRPANILTTNAPKLAIFDKLAGTVNAIPADVLSAYYALFGDLTDKDVELEMLRRVGFDQSPETAEEYVQAFIAERTS